MPTRDPDGEEPYDVTPAWTPGSRRRWSWRWTGPPPRRGPLRAAVVVIDAAAGEPLAIASRPNFDQARFATEDQLRNRA